MNDGEYECLREHMRHHNVKKWLIEGAEREDARTILRALDRINNDALERRLARALAKE
jgi:hypothetical protein